MLSNSRASKKKHSKQYRAAIIMVEVFLVDFVVGGQKGLTDVLRTTSSITFRNSYVYVLAT